MLLRRSVPVVLLGSAAIYLPIVILREALPPVAWESELGIPHATFVRLLASLVLALAAFAAMASSGISWGDFGFRRSRGGWFRLAVGAVVLGILSTLLVKAIGGGGLDAALAGARPVEIVLLLLVATCVEEFFVRGWIQGFLEPLRDRRIGIGDATISVPVATGALAFGAMHLSLTRSAIDAATIACVLAFTTLLGLLAGLARERSGSLGPAIATHLAGNIGGVLGGIGYVIATQAVPT